MMEALLTLQVFKVELTARHFTGLFFLLGISDTGGLAGQFCTIPFTIPPLLFPFLLTKLKKKRNKNEKEGKESTD